MQMVSVQRILPTLLSVLAVGAANAGDWQDPSPAET
jgi:hypothetical protein